MILLCSATMHKGLSVNAHRHRGCTVDDDKKLELDVLRAVDTHKKSFSLDKHLKDHIAKKEAREKLLKSMRQPLTKEAARAELQRLQKLLDYEHLSGTRQENINERKRLLKKYRKLLAMVEGKDLHWKYSRSGHCVPEHLRDDYETEKVVQSINALLDVGS